MNNPPLSREKTLQIFRNGIYYSPSGKHYNKPNTNVVCDRCHTTQLDVCIGYEDYDMCLTCIQEIGKQLKRKEEIEKFPTATYEKLAEMRRPDTKTYMLQSQFLPPTSYQTMTNMEQSQFKPPSRYQTKTNMEQSQFRPSVLTRMIQNQFIDNEESDEDTKTFMVQSQFRPNMLTRMIQDQFRN